MCILRQTAFASLNKSLSVCNVSEDSEPRVHLGCARGAAAVIVHVARRVCRMAATRGQLTAIKEPGAELSLGSFCLGESYAQRLVRLRGSDLCDDDLKVGESTG